MGNVTIKGLLAHKLRLMLTALAIVLGVTFISGTFVLTDTLHNTFSVLFGSVYQKIDFQVRGVAQLGSGANATRNELPESLLTTVRRVPGVAAAEGGVEGYAQFVARDGQPIQTGSAGTLGVSYDPDQQVSALHIIAGGPPVTSGDVVMDAGTAQKYHFTVGQRVRVLSAGPVRTFTISGIAEFGSAGNLAGATLAAFTLPTAQAVLQEAGQLDFIDVVTVPGASKPAVQRDIAAALPAGVQVVTGLALPAIALVGVGAVGIFVGVAMLSPAIARPLSSVIGRPLARLFGEPGKLGRENSMRSPRRTAQTASALMVGLALVAAMSVFGASLSRSATSSVDQAISADLIVSATGTGQLSQSVPARVSALPAVTVTTTVYRSQFEFAGSLATLTAVSTPQLADTVILRMAAGSPATLAQGDLLIDSTTAKSKHLSVGDTVPVKFALTGPANVRIGGIYQANALIGSYLVSAGFFGSHFSNQTPAALLLRTGGSGAADSDVTRALAPFPNAQVQTRAQFEQAQTASVNQLLGLVYALLALAVLIALIGIVNTLMLSVFERTREIGLLRAVGMKRRQVRTMIRSEAVILAIFGALIGIIIGTGMGVALVSSLKQQGITDTVVPASSLVVFLVLAALLGLLAASWPARRAARLDVLAAIAVQ
jgi:hypothetical protein